jgi:hypothetical protein
LKKKIHRPTLTIARHENIFRLPVLYASSRELSLSLCFPIAAAKRISDPSFCNSFVAVGRLLFDKKQTTTEEKTEEDFFWCVFKKKIRNSLYSFLSAITSCYNCCKKPVAAARKSYRFGFCGIAEIYWSAL